ncbi:MAG: hypothetical protein ABIA02_02100 [Candidatus Falkowbacteria bacterium]
MENNEIKNKISDEEKKEKEIKSKVEKYKDPSGLATKKLNFGLWYVEHKKLFRKIIIGILIAISVVSWSYTLYGFAYYLIKGMNEDELLARDLLRTGNIDHNYILSIAPKDLQYHPIDVLKADKGKYDLVVRIQNPNDRWRAQFDYYFLAGEEIIGKSRSFILPNEEKYLTALSQTLKTRPSEVYLVINNIGWSRINRHDIPDWEQFNNNRLNIEINNKEFIPAGKNKLSGIINLNEVSFVASNKTAYNYWEVDFTILLYSGLNIVGVNKYTLSEFMSGEDRNVQMRWPGSVGNVTDIDVIPEIDIMDEEVYIEFEGGLGEEK